MHLQSPVWCKIFSATSSTIVTFSTKINLIIEAWTRKSQPWLLWGHSCPPELFLKNRQTGEPQNYFGHSAGFIHALSTKLRYCTLAKNIRLSVRKLSFVFRVKDGSPSPFWARRIHLLQQIRLSHLLSY